MNSNSIILHLGVGAFHRSHQAMYLQRLIEKSKTNWRIVGANIRADGNDVLNALIAQDGAYTLETVSPEGERTYQKITSIAKALPWDARHEAIVAQGANPDTRIISFTVTEGGYGIDTSGVLDLNLPAIAADVKNHDEPTTIYGVIAKILKQRIADQAGPVTLLSCDNLRGNGHLFQRALIKFLKARGDEATALWLQGNATFPNSMVDRITPRPTADISDRVAKQTGFADRAPVLSEVFAQWVIEDQFCNGRPSFEEVGAELVTSVLPYEEAKIRILNASHSCLAWAGTLKGFSYIHEDVANADVRRLAFDYVTEDVIPCLQPNPLDLAAYRDITLNRFSNPFIQDTNQRVSSDSIAKFKGFIYPTIRDCIGRGATIDKVSYLPALLFMFLERWNAGTLPFEYQDSNSDLPAVRALFNQADALDAFCKSPILWQELAGNAQVVAAVKKACNDLKTRLV